MAENREALSDREGSARLVHPLLQTARGYLTDEDYVSVEATLSEAVERAKDLEAENERLREALTATAVTTCREWCDEKADHCHAPAEFLIWGKLTPPNGLGPRCYDHAAEHVGHRALGDPSWAIVDLRPARLALQIDETNAPPLSDPFKVVKMFDGTWNVRDDRTDEWVRNAVHLSKPEARRRADEMNAALAFRETNAPKETS